MDIAKRIWTGFVNVVVDTVRHIRKAQITLVASSLSYITILSLIPLLALSLAVFQAFGGLQKIYSILEPFILNYLAEGISEQVIEVAKGFIQKAHTSTLGIGGFLGLVLTSMTMLLNVERAINRAWDAPISRTWFRRISSYWLFITLGPMALAIVLGVASSHELPIARYFPNAVVTFGIGVVFFFCVYKWVPHTRVTSWCAMVSGLLTALAFAAARYGYEIYIAKAVSYHHIYGSLAAIPIFLLWIYIVWLVILGGAALTAALQKNLAQ